MHGNSISKHNAECNTGMIDCVQFFENIAWILVSPKSPLNSHFDLRREVAFTLYSLYKSMMSDNCNKLHQ